MSDDLELERRLAALRTDRMPEADLWPGIAARIAATPRSTLAPRLRSWGWPAALAAGLVAAVGVATLSQQNARDTLDAAQASAQRAEAARWVAGQVRSLDDTFAGAVGELRAEPSSGQPHVSPGLYAAAAQLEAAETELKATLAAQPRATYLIEILGRTQAKRLELEKLIRAS